MSAVYIPAPCRLSVELLGEQLQPSKRPDGEIGRHIRLKRSRHCRKKPYISRLYIKRCGVCSGYVANCKNRPDGEIGIRSGLKIRQTRVYAGSSPARGTRPIQPESKKPLRFAPQGLRSFWRRGPESNRARRICNPLHNRFATAPWSLSIKQNRPARPYAR